MSGTGTHSELWREFCEAGNLASNHPTPDLRKDALRIIAAKRSQLAAERLGALAAMIANRRRSGMRRRIDEFERRKIDELQQASVPLDRIAGLIGVEEIWLWHELGGEQCKSA